MESKPRADEQGSLASQVAALLSRAFESRTLSRLAAVIALVWLWLTLLGLTLAESREILYLLTGRAQLSVSGLGDLAVPASLLYTTVSALIAIPGVLAWNQLLHLARTLGQLAIVALNWPTEDDAPDVRILRLQHLIEEAVRTFVRWFQWFAVVWILIIAVAALAAVFVFASSLLMR